MLVRVFRPAEWSVYRDIRLAALKESPDAFGSRFEDAVTYPDTAWQERLLDAVPERDLPLLGLVNGKPTGLCWAKIEEPGSLTAHLFSMWVDPRVRQSGLGRLLLETAMQWAAIQGCKEMALDVTCGNLAAEKLYESLGFVVVGEPIPLREGSDLMERSMVAQLSR